LKDEKEEKKIDSNKVQPNDKKEEKIIDIKEEDNKDLELKYEEVKESLEKMSDYIKKRYVKEKYLNKIFDQLKDHIDESEYNELKNLYE
jgi:hypothetical protein